MGWWPDQCQTHTKTTTVRCYSITFHRMNFNLELHNYSCRLLTISSVKTPLLVSYSKNEFIISKPACCRIVSVFFAWKCIYEGGNGICPYNVHPINYFWDPEKDFYFFENILGVAGFFFQLSLIKSIEISSFLGITFSYDQNSILYKILKDNGTEKIHAHERFL